MSRKNENPGAAATATGAEYKHDDLLFQNTATTKEIKPQAFYWSQGGSVERLSYLEVAA